MPERHNQQGTGRHPHKDSQEPWPHTKEHGQQHGRGRDNGDHDRNRGREHETAGASHSGHQQNESDSADLKRREYRGEDGQIHHHTHTYMEDHKGEHGRDGNDRSSGGRSEHRGGGDHNRGGSNRSR